MLFTSLTFAVFFFVVLCGLLVWRRNEHKILWLIGSGAVFYGYWDWRFLALLAFTSVFDFYLGKRIAAAQGALRKRLLVLDIIVNLGILCVFKYLNFFIASADAVLAPLGIHWRHLDIILPIGISFFVFEVMSYCIDIYRGQLQPYTNWRHFALFIFFFPRMIAGPIIRPADFLPQLQRDIRLRGFNFFAGGQMFLMGLTKKLVVADNLAPFVDLVFAHPEHYSGASVWQAVVAYSIQIFCDFSGYSDMALGLAKIMGFELPVNFRMPYASLDITEFWRRWHISLSSWLRDYLYIPLGGNRKGVARTYLNLLITMTLGGLWHGASWNFVVWGFLQGLGLMAHKAWKALRRGDARPLAPQPASAAGAPRTNIATAALSWALTYIFVCFCWVFFRAQSFPVAWLCVLKMAGALRGGMVWICGPLLVIAPAVLAAHALGLRWKNRAAPVLLSSRLGGLVVLFTWALGIFFFAATRSAPFIYFQF